MYHYLKPKFRASRARIHRLMVNRNFNPPLPNMIWVGDITYIKTAQGWLYLAIIKDLCTKKIVGYSFSNRIDSKLVCEALIMSINRQNPPVNLIFHSDLQISSGGRQHWANYIISKSSFQWLLFSFVSFKNKIQRSISLSLSSYIALIILLSLCRSPSLRNLELIV